MPNIDVQIKGRTFTALGGNVFAVALGPASNSTSHGVVHVDKLMVDRVRVGERWRVTENIDQVDGTNREVFGAPFPDGRTDYSQAVFGNTGRHARTGSEPDDDKTTLSSAVTAAAAWSNTQPSATARFTILKRAL